ncbi:MAG: ATP-binding cassette domain-containing protein, partial [Clostridium sp.]|nr:ATP-binding cassette domain-containing protein [Clostridium sp.]
FDVDRGEKIVISGYSGSGKSTLSKIICGYLEIDNDMIYIDGIDINSHNIIKLTRDVCYISQKEVMFTDSIYNNIIMERDISYEKFLEVCKITGVDTMVKSKLHSYNFLLEEGGFNISGGERQRIILARALLKDASIYIFDESFSEMDVDSEGKILSKIFGYLADKTILVISHRDNNNLLFDKCFTIKNGKIYNGYYKI